jgi:hypothetical protein
VKGWICPKCDRVYAPHVSQCWECNRREVLICHPPTLPHFEFVPAEQTSEPLRHPFRIICGSDGSD